MCCNVENSVELPQVDAIHSSNDSVTVVDAIDDQRVDQSSGSVSRQYFSDRM